MTVTVLGTVSMGVAVPGAAAAAVLGVDGINAALPELQAKLTALAGLLPTPISLALNLDLANQILDAVDAAMTALPPLPALPSLPTVYADVIVQITDSIATLGGKLAALAAFQALLSAGGIALYAFDGQRNQLGAQLGAALGGGGATGHALILYTEDPATWTAMGGVFKVSP